MLEGVAADVEALADRLVAGSARPEVAALIRPDLADVLKAMVAGAKVVGPSGQGERANLFRLAGLPVEKVATQDADPTKARLAGLADRLEVALARRDAAQARLGRAEDGTSAPVLDAKPKASLTFDA